MIDEAAVVRVRTLGEPFREAGRRVRNLCMPKLRPLDTIDQMKAVVLGLEKKRLR